MTVTIAFGPPPGAAGPGAGGGSGRGSGGLSARVAQGVSAGVSGALSAGWPQAALSAKVGISHQLGTRRMENSSGWGTAYGAGYRLASSTSGLSRPAWKVRPDSVLVSQTSAGLKSRGSIL